jgi:hypothetical protein
VLAATTTEGAVSRVVYDVFPGEAFGDDTAVGSRYTIVGRQQRAGGLPATGFGAPLEFVFVSAEARALCSRGVVAASGACV